MEFKIFKNETHQPCLVGPPNAHPLLVGSPPHSTSARTCHAQRPEYGRRLESDQLRSKANRIKLPSSQQRPFDRSQETELCACYFLLHMLCPLLRRNIFCKSRSLELRFKQFKCTLMAKKVVLQLLTLWVPEAECSSLDMKGRPVNPLNHACTNLRNAYFRSPSQALSLNHVCPKCNQDAIVEIWTPSGCP